MPAGDWYSLDKRRISSSRWVETIRSRIVAVRGLERPIPLPPGSYTGACTIGRQRGLQRALGVHVRIRVGARIRARARDSTHREIWLG